MERSLFWQVWQEESERLSESAAKGDTITSVMEGVPCRSKAILLNSQPHSFQEEEDSDHYSLHPVGTREEHLLVTPSKGGQSHL